MDAAAPAIRPRRVRSKVMEILPAIVVLAGRGARPGLAVNRDWGPSPASAWRCPLHVYAQHEDRLGRGHEDMVALGAGKAEIGARLGQADAADQLAVRIPHRDPRIAQHRS